MARLPEAFIAELRLRTPIVEVIGRRVALKRVGRDLVGLCPFHGEKTPSFHIYPNDDNQRAHCFGCGWHGDVIRFVMDAEHMDFREAVATLAQKAGLEVPTTPEERAADEQRTRVLGELAKAHEFYRACLLSPEIGARARAYLTSRGVDPQKCPAELGWASGLAWPRIDREAADAAGLLRRPEGMTPRGPLFFNRVIFPVRDARGRVISFIGRTLGEAQPKYLNGYNSEVFNKGATLYRPSKVIPPPGDEVAIVEGPMDAIASDAIGIPTYGIMSAALSAEHLSTLWRVSQVPVLCLDGDQAGRDATWRAIVLALPHITPGDFLRVALLPAGEDPDVTIRLHGADFFRDRLGAAYDPAEALYELARPVGDPDTRGQDTLQRAAHLDAVLAELAKVGHRDLRWHMLRAVRDRHYARRRPPQAGAAAVNGQDETARVMTALLLRHPAVIDSVREAWERLSLPPLYASARQAILDALTDDLPAETGALARAVHERMPDLVGTILADSPLPLPPFAHPEALDAEAEAGFWACRQRLAARDLQAEVEAAREAMQRAPSPANERRLIALTIEALGARREP